MEGIEITARIYISGPISGLDREEYLRRFNAAEQALRKEGYINIVNPTRLLPCRFPSLYKLLGYRITLFYDLWVLTRCQRIYKMPGWRASRGAQIESCVAYHFGVWTIGNELCEKIDAAVGGEDVAPANIQINASLQQRYSKSNKPKHKKHTGL